MVYQVVLTIFDVQSGQRDNLSESENLKVKILDENATLSSVNRLIMIRRNDDKEKSLLEEIIKI